MLSILNPRLERTEMHTQSNTAGSAAIDRHPETRLAIKKLCVTLGEQGPRLLNNVSLSVHAGEIVALVGESGSGKSITSLAAIRLLPDALQVTAGEVELGDQALFSLTEQQMQNVRGRNVTMIFQDALTALNPVQTVGHQLAETLRQHTRLNPVEIRQRCLQLFEEVGLDNTEQRLNFYPHQLSGGQQQRIMIAMALACEPEVLIADEPTTALDVTIQKQILELIVELARSRNLAVLLITHDMAVVKNTADRVVVMYQGEIIEESSVDNFFHTPQHSYSKKLIDSLPDMHHYRHSQPDKKPLLSVDGLKVHFPIRKGILQRVVDYTRAVDGLSLSIATGETLALVGESGSGKSTCGRAILNLEKLSGGSIGFNGQRIDQLSRTQMLAIRKQIQVIFQNPYSSMNPRMTVGSIIEEGMISLGLGLNKTQRRERIDQLLQRVRLQPEFRHRYPHEFSGGQRQRIAIARALAVNPKLIICDEPTSALDVSIRAEVLNLLLELQQEFGVSYLFITHDLSIVPHLAHRIAVMQHGKIVEQGDTEQVLNHPRHPYTQALLASAPRID
jgi:peptide/nickel transport system ATP-binding protein